MLGNDKKMIQLEVNSVASLIEVSRSAFQGFGNTVHWFRGQSSAAWGLVPTVHRDYDRAGEHNLAAHFRLSASTRHPKAPDLSDLSAWMSLMQHFGLPTRLLDWTASPLVALFFALDSERHTEAAAVWGLVPSRLNAVSAVKAEETFVLSGPEARPLLLAGMSRGPVVEDVLAVVGQDIDLRMTLQQGAFTLHGTSAPLNERPDADGYLAKFIIPQSARKQIKEELWFLGIRRSGLFPDLANLALELTTDQRRTPRRRVV